MSKLQILHLLKRFWSLVHRTHEREEKKKQNTDPIFTESQVLGCLGSSVINDPAAVIQELMVRNG